MIYWLNMNYNIAFVPVRKGSKGVSGKNTRLLCGKPLLCWILDTLVQSSFFDEIWLATDCDETEKITIGRYGEEVKIYRRSDTSATDKSSVMEVIKEFIFGVNRRILIGFAFSVHISFHYFGRYKENVGNGKFWKV